MVYQYIPQRSISYLMFILYGTVDARQLYCLQKDIQPRSGPPTGQKVEIACFHISATFWLLKIIVLCVYVCTKHINIQLYYGNISKEKHTVTYSNQTETQENSSERKIFFLSRLVYFRDQSLKKKTCWTYRYQIGDQIKDKSFPPNVSVTTVTIYTRLRPLAVTDWPGRC